MCLIIEKTQEQNIKLEFFADVWKKNHDGWGIMWLNRRGMPAIVKGLKLSEFYRAYEKVKHKHLFIHFRFTTDGLTNWENAHPHKVLDDVYMMHNGVLSKFRTHKQKSDTAVFADEVVRPLLEANGGSAYLRTPECIKEIEKYTSQSNKLTFVDKQGFLVIEPQFWSRTLTGLRVSNSVGYSLDNPNHNMGYNHNKRTTYYEGEDNYGHNSKRYEEYSWVGDSNTADFREANKKASTELALVANNDEKKDKPLDIKRHASATDKDVDISHYLFLAEGSEAEIEDLFNVDPILMAKVLKAAVTEIVEYGYSAEKFRLSSS